MLRNIIAPVQAWLLSQNRCVGCSMPLDKATKSIRKGKTVFVCKCKRIYLFDNTKKTYRRALLNEV